jgi:DNA-binding CsgD family transcriptional regulator
LGPPGRSGWPLGGRAAGTGSASAVSGTACDTAARLGARQLHESCAAALKELGDRPRYRGTARRAMAGLTGREIDVMRLVAEGNTSRQIGCTLFISPRTVEMHVQSSMQKLQCRTKAEAVRRLADLGALPQR